MRPISKRKYYSFLSHSHANKSIVDKIDKWLSEIANIPIWYDSRNLPTGSMIATYLSEAIEQSKSMILIISKKSIESGWVREEYNAAIAQRAQFKDFRIIPIKIEECDIPGFLQTTKWIELQNDNLDIDAVFELLLSLYFEDIDLDIGNTKDLYISRTWRESETEFADLVCLNLHNEGFRLIGDSKDQAGFQSGDRVKSIISSCGGLVAILPDRGEGKTSEYMLKEIDIAQHLKLPILIVAEDTVIIQGDLTSNMIKISKDIVTKKQNVKDYLKEKVEVLNDEWKKPLKSHYIFYGTDFNSDKEEINKKIKRIVQKVAAMDCIMGDQIREGQIQEIINKKIVDAFLMIGDITNDNLNTCIEVGIARGANAPFHIVAKEPRKRPPFMFRDQQVWYYKDDMELIGKIHSIIFPYRRRVLNYELHKSIKIL